MIVQIFGPSGVGKSTILESFDEHSTVNGLAPSSFIKEKMTSVSRGLNSDDKKNLVSKRFDREFMDRCFSLIWSGDGSAPQKQSSAAILYRSLESEAILSEFFSDYNFFADELVIHRCINVLLFCDNLEKESEWFFSNVPLPDAAVLVSAPNQTIVERVTSRRAVHKRNTYYSFSRYSLEQIVERQIAICKIGAACLSQRTRFAEVNADSNPAQNLERFGAALNLVVNGDSAEQGSPSFLLSSMEAYKKAIASVSKSKKKLEENISGLELKLRSIAEEKESLTQENRILLDENAALIEKHDAISREYESIRSRVESISREKELIVDQLSSVTRDRDWHNERMFELASELDDVKRNLKRIRGRLVYKLLNRFSANIRTPSGWLRMLFDLPAVAISHLIQRQRAKTKTASRDSSVTADADMAALVVRAEQSRKQSRKGDSKVARTAVAENLTAANLAILDDEKWLHHTNEYLRSYGVSPIQLRSGNEPRFFRIFSNSEKIKKDGPLITVIMPAFNAEKTLLHAASSILGQTWQNIELIIVDDKSTDATWDIANAIAAQDRRVIVLRNDVNVGPYVSKNRALSEANGDYITGHDADDWAHPERLQNHIEAMLARRTETLAGLTSMLRMTEDGVFETTRTGDGFLRGASISTMFKAEAFRQYLGAWDSVRFGADSELIARASIVFGNRYKDFRQFGMFCLASETSLTGHPVHGVSAVHGISPSRRYYREQWTEWHKTISTETSRLDFPQRNRLFDAPEAALVPLENVLTLMSSRS